LTILCCRRYFFQKPPQFSQGNNVIDVPACDTTCFPLTNTCVSSSQLTRLTWKKHSLSQLWKTKLQEILPPKTDSVLTGKHSCKCSSFEHKWLSFERYMCLFNSASPAYFEEREPTPHGKPKMQKVFLSKTNSNLTGKQCASCSWS
jgi:hypothetical protein